MEPGKPPEQSPAVEPSKDDQIRELERQVLELEESVRALAADRAGEPALGGRAQLVAREAREVARRREDDYRTIVETTDEGIWRMDANRQTGFVNRRLLEMLGCSAEDMLGRSVMDFIAPGERQSQAERLQRRSTGETQRYETRLLRRDGVEIHVSISATPVRDATGNFVGSFGMIRDISREYHVRQALQRSERSFRELIEELPENVWVSRGGRIVYVNRQAVEAMRADGVDDLVGRQLSTYFHPADRAALEAHLAASGRRQGPADACELRLLRGNGELAVVETRARLLTLDGQPAVILLGADVTQHKRLEADLAQAERLATIGTLTAGVVHEINDPLSYASSSAELIARTLADLETAGGALNPAVLKQLAGEACEGLGRIRAIVRGLSTFSRLDDGARRSVDIHRVLDSALTMVWNEIRHRAQLIKDYAGPLLVEGDEPRLGHAFLSLLLNAAQAIPAGAADSNHLRLSTRAEGAALVVEIADTGEGMSRETLSHLFTPFFTTRPQGRGSGLGLSVCKRIIEEHQGSIELHSEPGTGTTVWVRLPLAVLPN